LSLPATIRIALEARVERLSAQARQVLDAGAVLGQTFTFDLVQRTAGRGDLETVDGLDELVARQLLREADGQYRFIHQLNQAVVYRGLSRQRCRLLHRRAGEALEKLRPGDVAALTRHFELAEESGRAARYALQAGLAAKAVYGHSEARAYFERAMTLLEGEAADLRDPEAIAANRRLRIQALYERGWALRLLGDMEAHAQDLKELSRLVELLGDRCALAHLHWREAYTHRWLCRYAEAREAAEAGLSLSHAVGKCTLMAVCQDEGLRVNWAAGNCLFEAMCWREAGIAAREMGDYGQAQSALGLALDLYVQAGEAVYEIHTLGNLSTLYWYLGDYEKAIDLCRAALERCEEAGLPLERRLPLGDLGAASAALGDTDLARECLLESLSIAREIADRTQEIFCLGHLGWLYVELRQPARALEHLQAGLALAERIRSCAEQSQLLSGLAEAHRLAGECERAQVRAHRALELAQATGRPYDEGLARHVLDRLEGG
jgi:tetratricopeptide (TPR) repeat protein